MEGGEPYPLLVYTLPGERELVITAGFHGDEVAGPLTLLAHLGEVIAHARARGIGLRVYPLLNPTGFEDGTRYNRSGERPNNDLLRYELATGEVRGELAPGEPFRRWLVHRGGPAETRALARELERHPAPVAALDLHQDPYLKGGLTYAYVFGDRTPYRPLQAAASAHAVVIRSRTVDPTNGAEADADGFVELRDGSVTDYFDRRGTRYTVALETTTDLPAAACDAVNLIWIHGMIELAAGDPAPPAAG